MDRNIEANKFLPEIKNVKTRNLVRGLLAENSESISTRLINKLKRSAPLDDLAVISDVLFSEGGIRPKLNKPREFISLCRKHDLKICSLTREFIFSFSYMNGRRQNISELVDDIIKLNQHVAKLDKSSLREVENFYENWGLSNFLIKKFCFLVKNSEIDSEFVDLYRKLTQSFRVSDFATSYFQILDQSGLDSSIFSQIEIYLDTYDPDEVRDYRQINSLHNVVPVPLSAIDTVHYIQKSHVSSFVDEVISLKVIVNSSFKNSFLANLSKNYLDQELVDLLNCIDQNSDQLIEQLSQIEDYDDKKHHIACLIFVEFKMCTLFRAKIDYALLYRIVPDSFKLDFRDLFLTGNWVKDKSSLSHEIVGFNAKSSINDPINDGTLLRTARYLCFLKGRPHDLDFSDSAIKRIFNNTTGLQYLMSSEEIDRLYALSSLEGRHIVSTLSLAIKREKEFNEDVDYTFRRNLEKSIIKYFNGDLLKFIEWLNFSAPRVAKFLVNILDRNTIEKLYVVIDGSLSADTTRQNILNLMAEYTGDIEYLIYADKIKVDNKIKSIRRHIERSRVYIDEYSFRKWINDNSIRKIGDYHRFTKNHFDKIRSKGIILKGPDLLEKEIELQVLYDFDHLIEEMLIEAYNSFCTNLHFGLDSYIGRRIRHNTLRGVMQSASDRVTGNRKYRSLYADPTFKDSVENWERYYETHINDLRLEKLYFRSSKKLNGMLISDASNAKSQLNRGVNLIKFGLSQEVPLDDLASSIIEFCWDCVQPQLRHIEKYLKVELIASLNARIDEYFRSNNTTHHRFRTDLKHEVGSELTKIGNWFKVPENTVESATINEIVGLVYSECETNSQQDCPHMEVSGANRDLTIQGAAVHYLYDCLDVVLFNIAENAPSSSSFNLDFRLANPEIGKSTDLTITVTSKLKFGDEGNRDYEKVREQFEDSSELSTAMVKEGLTGIRKLRFLVEKLKRKETIMFKRKDDKLTVSFNLPITISDGGYENTAS